jgi:phosphoglycolate phosphatase-like HAD superfamily hydrolase
MLPPGQSVNHPANMMRLLLFDIDGTLVHSKGIGRAAMAAALKEVYGATGPIDAYVISGQTDWRIVVDLMAEEGWSRADVEARFPSLFEQMAAVGGDLFFRQGTMRACPGVKPLLRALHKREDVVLGLLTGNAQHTAPLKLRAAGIDPGLFQVGAYGSDSIERNDLLALARQRAADLTGRAFAGAETVLIGDTPADILCAQQGKAQSLAVATGQHTLEALGVYAPDFLFKNLGQTDTVMDVLLNGGLKADVVAEAPPAQAVEIDGIVFKPSGATTVSRAQLFNWVVWQFPRLKRGEYCAAVRAPHGDRGWLPALIAADEDHVRVYAGLKTDFPTPEAAVNYLDQLK